MVPYSRSGLKLAHLPTPQHHFLCHEESMPVSRTKIHLWASSYLQGSGAQTRRIINKHETTEHTLRSLPAFTAKWCDFGIKAGMYGCIQCTCGMSRWEQLSCSDTFPSGWTRDIKGRTRRRISRVHHWSTVTITVKSIYRFCRLRYTRMKPMRLVDHAVHYSRSCS